MAESSYIHLCLAGFFFFFSVTLSSKHFVLCRRFVAAFYAIQHVVRCSTEEVFPAMLNTKCSTDQAL